MGLMPIVRGGYPSTYQEQHDSSKLSKLLSLLGLSHPKDELQQRVSFHLGIQ